MGTYIDSTLTISGRKLPSTYTRTIRTTVDKIRRGDLIVSVNKWAGSARGSFDSHVASVVTIGESVGIRLASGEVVPNLAATDAVYVERTYVRKPKGLSTSGGAGSTAYTRKAA